MLQRLILILYIVCQSVSGVFADEQGRITVAGTEIPGLMEIEGKGPYYQVFQALTAEYIHPVKLNITPIRRATRTFVSGGANCIFSGSDTPGYYEQLGLDDELIQSHSVYLIRTKIYSRKGSVPIESIKEIEGKFIAIDTSIGGVAFTRNRLGHDAEKVLPASSLADGFDLLDSGRVAGLVAIDNDVKYLIAQEPRYGGYAVSEHFSVNVGSDLVVCKKSDATERFITYINDRIVALKAEGAIEAIMHNAIMAVRAAQ